MLLAQTTTGFSAILSAVDFTQFVEMFYTVAVVGVPAVIGIMLAKKGVSYLMQWIKKAR